MTLVRLLYIGKSAFGLVALLNSATLHIGGPFVDLSRLQKAKFDTVSRDDIDQVNELIKVTDNTA